MSTPQEWVPHALENRAQDLRKLHEKFNASPKETVQYVSTTLVNRVTTILQNIGCPLNSETDDTEAASIAEQLLAEYTEENGGCLSANEINRLVLPFALIHARLRRALDAIKAAQPAHDTAGDSGILRVISLDELPPENGGEEGSESPEIEP